MNPVLRTVHPRLVLALALACAALAATSLGAARAQSVGALAVLVSQRSPVTDLTLAELRRIFLGHATVVHGQRLIPLNHPASGDVRTAFDTRVLRMNAAEVGRYWIAERIRGGRSVPKSVGSTPLLVKVVAKLPGAISYVPAGELPSSVRVVRIDGALPGDASYALR